MPEISSPKTMIVDGAAFLAMLTPQWQSEQSLAIAANLPLFFLRKGLAQLAREKQAETDDCGNWRLASPKPRRGRPPGRRNRRPASGSLSPTTQTKKGKTYPVVAGERVHRDLAYDYPHQFLWLYNWAIQDADGVWKNRSKRVPPGKVHGVKSAIARHEPIAAILKLIDS